jgi:hypothetical protein
MQIVPFIASHAASIVLQPMQRFGPVISDADARTLEAVGPCYSALGDDGRVLACAGLIPQWEGRALAWGMVAHDAGPHLVRITREVRRFLASCGYARVEAAVDALFPAAIRWIEMLGFERETPEPMRNFAPSGRPAYLYARLSDG